MTDSTDRPGGSREMMRLAWPLIVSNSFFTLQIFIDRLLLTRYEANAVSAATLTGMLFWTTFVLFQTTANYVTTFVAQYLGAQRIERIGPVVWQGLYFSLASGLLFLLLIPLSGPLFQAFGHAPELMAAEGIYFRCLTWICLPMLILATISGFFAGLGDSRTVMWLNLVGLVVNVVLDYLLIYGVAGFPELGIRGAGLATIAAAWVSALVAIGLFLREKYRSQYGTLHGWRLELPLFGRLMRYGVPSGMQWMLEGSAFTVFFIILGEFGKIEFAASSVAFTINMLAFLPMMGIGQAVAVLVGQRLGEDQPEIAERSTYTGFVIAWVYMASIAVFYVAFPSLFIVPFASANNAEDWPAIAAMVRALLWFIALYSLFDSMNLVFSFALRGAGDTLFVSLVSLSLSWPLMVIPSALSLQWGWSPYWPWAFAAVYIVLMACIFLLRFRTGKWKSMRVIEPVMVQEPGVAIEPSEIAAEVPA